MKQLYRDYWIVGSFDRLVLWDRASGKTIDYLTKQPIMPRRPGPPQQQVAVTGFSNDFLADDIAFGYSFGARYIHKNGVFVQMPQEQMPNKISMWHLALAVHPGRIYQPSIVCFFYFNVLL